MTHAVLQLSFEQEDADILRVLEATAPDARQILVKEALRQFLGLKEASLAKTDEGDLGLEELFVRSGLTQESPEIPLPPWEHLLNDVIGQEEDESVIAAIQALKSQSPANPEVEPERAEPSAVGLSPAEVSAADATPAEVPMVGARTAKVSMAGPGAEGFPLSERSAALPRQAQGDGAKGMAHLLQVIGEEEDEELAAFLRKV